MVNPIRIRFALFLIGCIGSRLAITAISAYSTGWFLRLIGYLALLPVIGWAYIIFIGKRDTGVEVLGGKIWWNHLRPIHMILWAAFAYLAITDNKKAWMVLLFDTLFGLSAFLVYHWSQGNFNRLLE
jgi:hypothetical protein